MRRPRRRRSARRRPPPGGPDIPAFSRNIPLTAGVDPTYSCNGGDDCQPRVTEYDAGTLVLDFVDTRTNTVVWRGWAQNNMGGVIDDQDRLEQHVAEAVRRMMEEFPGTL